MKRDDRTDDTLRKVDADAEGLVDDGAADAEDFIDEDDEDEESDEELQYGLSPGLLKLAGIETDEDWDAL